MPYYYQVVWLPLVVGIAVLGLAGGWLAWRRRGAAAGLRVVAWSLIPLAAYWLGVVALVGQVIAAVTRFAVRFVFSLEVWAGVVLTGAILVLLVTARVMRRRGIGVAKGPAPLAGSRSSKVAVPAGADDGDLAEIEALLRQRGIT
jgi:hypothetical protein